MSVTRDTFRVEICKFADFGETEEFFTPVRQLSLKYDELTLDGRVPTFEFELNNRGGVAQAQWTPADVIKIWRNEQLDFIGTIDKVKKTGADRSRARFTGTHYYYSRLVDNILLTASQLVDARYNVYRFGRKTDGDGELTDGIKPSTILKAVTGNKLVFQEFYDTSDNVDKTDWFRNPSSYVDATVAIDEPDFENNDTNWIYADVDLDGNEDIVYGGAATSVWSDVGRTSGASRTGDYRYKLTLPSGAIPAGDGAIVYQDGVTLEAGQLLYAYVALNSASSVDHLDALNTGARILIFENNTFDNPITGEANKGFVVGTRVSGMTQTYVPVGGIVNLPTDGTYRIAIHFFAAVGFNATNALDFSFDSFQLKEPTVYDGVSIFDGFLSLHAVEAGDNITRYRDSGIVESVDYYAGNPNIRLLPDFNTAGSVDLKVIGTLARDPNDMVFTFEDSSGNANDLTATQDPIADFSGYAKYGLGARMRVSSEALTSTGAAHDLAGDMSAFYTVDLHTVPDANEVDIHRIANTGKNSYRLYVDENGYINYEHDWTSGTETFTGTTVLTENAHTITVTRNTATTTVVVKVDGVSEINTTYTNAPDSSSFTGAFFGDDTESVKDIQVSEVRLWNTVVAQATLDAIADPADDSDQFTAEGTEVALYWFNNTPTKPTVPTLKLIYKRHVYGGADTVDAAVTVAPSTTTLLDASTQQYCWEYTHTPPATRNKLRVRFEFSGDSSSTARLDYYLLDADIENAFREIKYVAGDQVYRDATTGISTDDTAIEDYFFPTGLLDAGANDSGLYDTFAMEFFNQMPISAVADVVSATIKSQTLTDTDLPNLIASRSPITSEDSNWDFQVTNTGKILFNHHIGNYYGKWSHPSVRKTYAFNNHSIKLIDVDTESAEIINNLIYEGQGINGINVNVLSGDAYINELSVNQYGMKTGKVQDKGIFDPIAATNRAFGVLRERASPRISVKVEFLPDFTDEFEVGDIVHVRDRNVGIDDDFRVLYKSFSVTDSGRTMTVELANKNRTIESVFDAIGRKFIPLDAQRGGSGYVATSGGVPKVISRDIPYILAVDIPSDADTNLQRVTLNGQSEPVFSTQTIMEASEHTHGLPTHTHNVTVPSHDHSIPGSSHSHLNVITVPDEEVPATGGATLYTVTDSASQSSGNASTYPGTAGSDAVGDYTGFMVDVQLTNQTAGADWIISINLVGHGIIQYDELNNLPHNEVYRVGVYIPSAYLRDRGVGSITNLSITLTNNGSGSQTKSLTGNVYGVALHDHGLSFNVTSNNTTPASVTSGGGGGSTPTTASGGGGTLGGGAHTHEAEFNLRFNKNAAGDYLFPVNIGVSINDIEGLGTSGGSTNRGPIPELANLGNSETGDLTISQDIAIGFILENHDISHVFKRSDGTWITGRHYLSFHSAGVENQVNKENVGILMFDAKLEQVRDFNRLGA